MAASSSSSSSVLPTRRKGGWTYDVFLSFRGEDTRNNFVDHLFDALQRNGIQTFKDDEMLGGGQPISEELLKAIKESRWAVVVFSKNYATSSWCLEELSNIMECHKQMGGQKIKVLPVFYHVDPSDVRGQKRDFATAFEKHEDKFKGEMEKVNKWREALTAAANLSGQHILPLNGGEAAFISKIVQQILAEKQPRGDSRENHLIGIQPRIDALISLLKMEATEEVRIVGICGMGGIGKTTIARALFERIAYKFEGSSFVIDIRENSSSKKDICALQKRILNDILGKCHGYKIKDRYQGAKIIQERCCRKKVLLVLDDVNDVKQLEFLAATDEWFGPGSRIIITTRDQHLLSYANANDKYSPALLRTDQALELFSRHAFRKSSPPDWYMDLTNRAISYTRGLPLALKVLGSFLYGREANVWGSALDTLAKTPSGEVFDTLKLSYDYLNDFEKKIFLDIACFYKGKRVDEVTRILDCCGFHPVIGISVLVEKSLITISSGNTLEMHDLVEEMGRKVVQASAPNSRLWELEKIHDLIKKKELEVIEGIVLPWKESMESLRADVFKSMRNLRILDCDGKITSCEPAFLPDGLRWLCWSFYPFSSLPVAHMSKLVGLKMDNGKCERLWKGEKIMLQNLKFIHLCNCNSLTRFPDVSGVPNIESLDLSSCDSLVEVDESVGSLKKLVKLNMSWCSKLKCLPSMLKMESLKTLIMWACVSLERIPEFSPCMVNLSKLHISECPRLQEVPSSIKYLSNLKELNLRGCSILGKLPDDFQSMESLEELHIHSIHIHAFTNSCYLRKLHLHVYNDYFPKNLHGLFSLEELHIYINSKLIQIPRSISDLPTLKHFRPHYCSGHVTLGDLPPRKQVLTVDNCELLEKIEDLSKENKCLNKIRFVPCPKLLKDEENGRYSEKMLDQSFIKGNVMDCFARHNKSYRFVDRLQEGGVFTLRGYTVVPNRKDFRIMKDSLYMLELDGATYVVKAKGVDVGSFVRFPFQITSFEELVPSENKYLVDVIGYITCVGEPMKKSTGAQTVEFNLTIEGGRQMRTTLWGSLGDELVKKAENPGIYSLILTSMSSKVYLGELGLSSTSSTQLIDNNDVPALKAFKNAIRGREMLPMDTTVVDTNPLVDTLQGLLQWSRDKKDGLTKPEKNIVFRSMIEIVNIRTRNGWYLITCTSGLCRKGLTRINNCFWCEGCNSSVLYPRIRFKVQLEVRDESASTVVLFDEAAEKLLNRTAKSLRDEEMEDASGEDVIPSVLRDLIGSKHVFEINGHTYYRLGEYEGFNCSQVFSPGMDHQSLEKDEIQVKGKEMDVAGSSKLPKKPVNITTPAKKTEPRKRNMSLDDSDSETLAEIQSTSSSDRARKIKRLSEGSKYEDSEGYDDTNGENLNDEGLDDETDGERLSDEAIDDDTDGEDLNDEGFE